MRAILPGRPQSRRQALSTAHWDGLRLVAYISGNAAVISSGPHSILQTLYIDAADPLRAITIEESSGRIAVCDEHSVYIYDPVGREEGLLRWQEACEHTNESGLITSLSWSSPEELLIGGSELRLWYLPDNGSPKFVWVEKLPYPTALAYCSPDGGLIASCGPHDRMVKIWRRLSFELDSTRFDVSYLPHPNSVTNLHWRKPWHTEQNLDNLLYTFCADNHLRVWAHLDYHSTSVMQHVAEIDMCETIQPRRLSVGSMSRRRYAFIIDSRDFSTATEKAVQNTPTISADHALEHLIEIANRSPEICIVLDGLGHMSAWGIENAGCKNKNPTEVFNIAHIADLNISISQKQRRLEDYTQFCIFAGGAPESSLSILVHSFDGSISWHETQITHLFDTAPRHERARLLTSWAGHDDPVKGIAGSQNGKLLVSWTEDGDVIVWRVKICDDSTSLLLQQSYSLGVTIVDTIFVGDKLVLLRQDRLQVLPSSTKYELQRSSWPVRLSKRERLEEVKVFYDDAVDIYQAHSFEFVTNVVVPPDSSKSIVVPVSEYPSDRQDLLALGPNGLITGLLSSENGSVRVVESYSTAITQATRVSAFREKVALVDGAGMLSIWDSSCGVREAELDFQHETVGSLQWHTTRGGNLLLAVACTFHVTVIAQRRYDNDNPWIRLRELRMRDHTSHAIGCVCFLVDGSLVVGAGNQLFIPEISIPSHHEVAKLVREAFFPPEPRKKLTALPITDVVDALSAALPIYHPHVLHQLLDSARFDLAVKVLISLHEHLKFFSEGDRLSSTLNFSIEALIRREEVSSIARLQNETDQPSQPNGVKIETPNGHVELEDVAERLKENIEHQRIPFLSIRNQSDLMSLIDTISSLERHRASVDEHALHYLHALYSNDQDELPWSAIMYASLSSSQEVLVELVTQRYGGKLTWEAARKSGLFMWLSELESVRTQMENVGRTEYTKHEDRNPVDCSLYYLALDKKNVLQGLWRTSVGIRERENTMKLLANDFNEPRWKATALKNAYALLSKRRFEYAAAFFLLGGNLKDAVSVCVHQIKDLQLAIAIARVYNNDGVVLKQVIEQQFLPAAAESLQGRWMACWAYHVMLGRREKAVQALACPLYEVLEVPLSKECLDYRINDPWLVILYAQLRPAALSAISPREEWVFIMRCATYLRRMGCDVLALSLVRNWEFVHAPAGVRSAVEAKEKVKESPAAEEEAPVEADKKKPPTQFVEPSADSLLDSFGF